MQIKVAILKMYIVCSAAPNTGLNYLQASATLALNNHRLEHETDACVVPKL